jgi:hypothetical protein
MITLFKKNKPSVPKEELKSWLEQVLNTNLLRWIGYKNKQEYEDEMQHQYNKEKFINENKHELEQIYLIRKKHNFMIFKNGGITGLKKERKYTSEQDWEQKYKPHRKSKVLTYKHHKNTQQAAKKCSWEYTIGGL